MYENFSNCGAESWWPPLSQPSVGACAAPVWARWPYLEPWVATIAFFVWIALYKTLECGGDVRAAIKAQLEGDEKHVRVAGCVEIKILRRVRAESSRRPPRHRRDACSTAWRCRFLAARPSQDGRVIAEK